MGKNIIAVDWGGSKIETGLVSPEGEILWSAHDLLPVNYEYDEAYLTGCIQKIVARLGREYGDPDAAVVGVSAPAVCDAARGVVISNGAGIYNWNMKADLEAALGLPVVLDKDTNACAVAEKKFGVCKDVTDFIWITVSSGCGSGLFLNNRLYHGAHAQAGEVGYIQVEFEDPMPVVEDGIPGDMEDEGCGNAMGRKYLRMMGKEPDPTFKSRQVGELARQGDEVAKKVFYRTGLYIARLCAMTANLLNLQKVVLGGGTIIYDYDLIRPAVMENLPKMLRSITAEDFAVEVTGLGYQASMLGAAAIAMETL